MKVYFVHTAYGIEWVVANTDDEALKTFYEQCDSRIEEMGHHIFSEADQSENLRLFRETEGRFVEMTCAAWAFQYDAPTYLGATEY